MAEKNFEELYNESLNEKRFDKIVFIGSKNGIEKTLAIFLDMWYLYGAVA